MLDARKFEKELNGKRTGLTTIQNATGLEIVLCNYGARVISLNYNNINVTPGYDSLEPYVTAVAPYHGATIGRYANRIAKGHFALHNQSFQLAINNAPNHLHGGPAGFHNQVWHVTHVDQHQAIFSYTSPAGEEGYPGKVDVQVCYTATPANELLIEYRATTDAATPFNITNHAFFNLNGGGTVLDHELLINAGFFTPVDASLIPVGTHQAVTGTAFDFTKGKRIGEDIDADEEQLKRGGGYDHNFVLNKSNNATTPAARAVGDKSRIVMEVFTSEPGLQLFSGNFEAVKGNAATFRNTFCLETQHFPDSPNQPQFPTTILQVGETFTSKTTYRFSQL